MQRVTKRLLQIGLATAVGAVGLFASESLLTKTGPLVTEAHARIGRPLTPMSYAGVARRTTRRAVAYGAYAAPVYAAPVVVAPACYQAVDAYGRIYTRCP
jgi:hypothetical protein